MMRSTKIILFLCAVGLSLSSCKEEPKKVIKTEPISFTKEGELSITKQSVDTLITKLDIEFAQSEYETQTGLMYRKRMEDSQGMLLTF